MFNRQAATAAEIKDLIIKTAGALYDIELPDFLVEIPADTNNGDFASNFALVSGRAIKKAPRDIAAEIIENIDFSGSSIESCEAAGPGFLNFKVGKSYFEDVVFDILKEGEKYGSSDFGQNEKVMVEFVSANPTGPMHMGNARGGAIGDSLARILRFAGYDVTTEFYVNDFGNQIEKFGLSLQARYLQIIHGEENIEFPEDGYHGDDIKERAKQFYKLHGDIYKTADEKTRKDALITFALPLNVEKLRTDLLRYKVEFDNWFFESSLYDSGEVDKVVSKLTENDQTYNVEGTLFYKNAYNVQKRLERSGKKLKEKEIDELKDVVLIRGNGFPTYFASDIAYHKNKFVDRGFKRVINIWGADHHGHVARMQSALDAIGLCGDDLTIILMQMVRLLRDGEVVRMSKRTGKSITLADLLEDIPIDAARYFFTMREPSSQMDFDLSLAVEQSSQNPVYYVQYAHARICSIIKNLRALGKEITTTDNLTLSTLGDPTEIELIRALASFPQTVIGAAQANDPSSITRFLSDTAAAFHKFYNACQVKGDNDELTLARLSLCHATATVIKNALALLNVSAPESM